ncbi:MAG TPA: M1 family aminopeptidase [Candidatus Kapabacteria bacterium]
MIKYFLLLLLTVFAASSSNAQQYCSKAAAHKHSLQSPQAFPDLPYRPYDVISYDIKAYLLDAFAKKKPEVNGYVTITLDLLETTTYIDFDAWGMKIEGLTINTEVQAPAPQPKPDETIRVQLPSKFREAGTRLQIGISYVRTSEENRGAHFYPKGEFVGLGPKPAEDSVFVEEDVFYTMCEPLNAHAWFPCNDQSDDKADVTVHVWVPNDGTFVTSNGLLSDTATTQTNQKKFSYYSDKPISTYLIAITASKFVSWEEMTPRYANPFDSIRLHYYAWQVDYDEKTVTDGSKYNATNAFKNTSRIMTAFEKAFGPYPFFQYGQVPVQPFSYGGMEHQTMTTINRSWLRGNWNESGIAHELGHQWFGDKVTCETFKDLWLNEGFATYSEAIYNESWGGDEWYRNTIRGKAGGYFSGENNDIPIYDPPAHLLFNGATVYAKGACVIHMLRRIVNNDNLFFTVLTNYTDNFAYDNCNTSQFTNYMSAHLGLDLDEYIDQWVFGPLHPIYDIKWAQDKNDQIFIRVNQTQDARDHFTMPIRFFAYRKDGGIDTLNYTNGYRSQNYRTLLSGEIDSIGFDNDLVILSEVTIGYDAAVSVGSNIVEIGTFSALLDAMTNELVCRNMNGPSLELYDMLGKKIKHISLSTGEKFIRLPLAGLANGAYLVRCGDQSAKVAIIR